MNKSAQFLAFDLGATSGRSIIGTLENGRIKLRELTRFPNGIIRVGDHYHWNIFLLFEHIKDGLKACVKEGIAPVSAGIDTWGVDFAFVAPDGTLLALPYAYRDPHTVGMPERYFQKLSREEVYNLTGIQIMNFNSIFQLFTLKENNSSLLSAADKLLFIPDIINYLLTGVMKSEFTFATTSQLYNPTTNGWEKKLFDAMDVNPDMMCEIVMPGTTIGNMTPAITEETGIGAIPMIAVAQHDTGSAIAAIPALNKNWAYLSSGTWSLMGFESEVPVISKLSSELNYTNEGGINGTFRVLKNITGLWLLEQCLKEWKTERSYSYPELVQMATEADPFKYLIDPDHESFANPTSMTQAIATYCDRTGQGHPQSVSEFVRCIFDSLALKYKQTLEQIKQLAEKPIEVLHVIGGGSQNALLCQMTANACGIPVVAGPAEATALGNIMVQAMAAGYVKDLAELRKVVSDSIETMTYQPQKVELFAEAFEKYMIIIKK